MCRPWSEDTFVVVHLPRGVSCPWLVVLPQSCSLPPFDFPACPYLYLCSDAALVGPLLVWKDPLLSWPQTGCEMVLDGGGHFIPAGIFGLHTTLSLLLSSQAAHDRATEFTHQYKRHTLVHMYARHKRLTRGYSNPRQGGINSVPL